MTPFKFKKNWPSNERRVGAGLLLIAAAALVALLLLGCNTVAPRQVTPHASSWDGTNQNSGVLGWAGDCAILTPHARDRYNGLIALYGKSFLPPLSPDYGVTATPTNTFLFTPEAVAKFSELNRRWRARP